MYAVTRYDAMCSSILACHGVDEVAEIRNKARAMEVYAKQAMNLDAERQAVEIRIRAERKAGELLSYMDRKQGGIKKFHSVHGRPNEIIKCNNCGELYDSTKWDSSISGKCPYCLKSDFQEAKEVSNISDSQAKRWQKLATIPEPEFEAALNTPAIPSTNGIVVSHHLQNNNP